MPEFVVILPVQIPNRLQDLFVSRLIAPTIRDGPELDKLFIQDTGELVQRLPGQPITTIKEARDLLNSKKLANAEYTAFQRQAIMGDIQFNLVPFVHQVTKTAIDIFQKNTQDLAKKTSQNISDLSNTTKQSSFKNIITRINQQNENKNVTTTDTFLKEKVGDKGNKIDLIDQQSKNVTNRSAINLMESPLEKRVSTGTEKLLTLSPAKKSIDISI